MIVLIALLLIVAVLGWSGVRGRVGLRIARYLLLGSVRDCPSDSHRGASVVAGAAA